MRNVVLGPANYIGADIVPQLIDDNNALFAPSQRRFEILDLTKDSLPTVDLIVCRDYLIHSSNRLVIRALRNIVNSGSKFVLLTTFPRSRLNEDMPTGGWRPLDLTVPPFGLPAPDLVIDECCPQPDYTDKCLGPLEIRRLPVLR